MSDAAETFTPELVERVIAGEHGLTLYGKSYPAKLRPHELAAFERARETHFIVFREPRPNLRNAWWLWCAATRTPLVMVRLRGGYAMVGLDVGPAQRVLTEDGRREIARMLSTEHGFPVTSALQAWSMRMPVDRAVGLAPAIYAAAIQLGVESVKSY